MASMSALPEGPASSDGGSSVAAGSVVATASPMSALMVNGIDNRRPNSHTTASANASR